MPRSNFRTVWLAISLAAFLAGAALGRFALGPGTCEEHCATPTHLQAAEPSQTAGSNAREEELERALESSWLDMLRLATKVESLESLLEELQGGDLDHRQLVQSAIANLGERELQSIVASAASLNAEDLEAIEDMPAFAARLAEVAMEDIVEPGAEPTGGGRVLFTTSPETDDPASLARSRFTSQDARIYAVFPTADYAQGAVMIKWYRSDPPQILLFRRYAIRPGDRYGYVWLRPKDGWEPGQYRVDVYAADEAVTRLARGHYSVAP
jgi:hypothetical protein